MTKIYQCIDCGKDNKVGYSKSNKFCNNQCQANHRKKEWFLTNESLFQSGSLKSRVAIKKFITLRDGYKCSICDQLPLHCNKPLVMILDHIDGDASNNMPSNFRLVCPNCDTQLSTYKSRNRGNGRATKGMKWYSRL